MDRSVFSHGRTSDNSPEMPVWMPSQFKGAARSRTQRRESAREAQERSLGETIANAVSNGVGAALSLAGLVILVVVAALHGGGPHVLVALAFALPMLLSFLMSTLYHAIPAEGAKEVFQVLDHSFVYLFIAGAYTPYCLITLANVGGPALCAFEWVVAIAGILVEAVWANRPRWLPIAICAVMGLAGLSLFGSFSTLLEPAGWWLLVAAVLCFCVSLVLYAFKRVPYLLFVSHLIVIGGSVCLFLSVVLFVV